MRRVLYHMRMRPHYHVGPFCGQPFRPFFLLAAVPESVFASPVRERYYEIGPALTGSAYRRRALHQAPGTTTMSSPGVIAPGLDM